MLLLHRIPRDNTETTRIIVTRFRCLSKAKAALGQAVTIAAGGVLRLASGVERRIVAVCRRHHRRRVSSQAIALILARRSRRRRLLLWSPG